MLIYNTGVLGTVLQFVFQNSLQRKSYMLTPIWLNYYKRKSHKRETKEYIISALVSEGDSYIVIIKQSF